MAKITGIPTVRLAITFELNEAEARALDALSGYGDDAFIKVFYESLGKSYMQDHEAGLRTFLVTIREVLPGILARADKARKSFRERPAVDDNEL